MPIPTSPKNQLGRELYELMQGPSGAAPAAISAKPGLMSLSYIQAEAPRLDDREAQEIAVAVTAQGFIEAATYALDKQTSQREHTDADSGAAARYLLAIEQGTASMPLHERRKRAAECLYLKDAASLRHRHIDQRSGLAESRETKLMDAVADKLLERDNDFRRAQSSANPGHEGVAGDSHWLAAVHNAWETARRLSITLKMCIGFRRHEPDMEYDTQRDYTSLESFGKFWQYVEIPAKDGPWFVASDSPETGRASLLPEIKLAVMFGRGLPEILFVSSPFEREEIERLSTEIVVTQDTDPSPVIRELITPWQAWLDSCLCFPADPDPESCETHWFSSSLEQYIDELRKCWDELRDPYYTPAHFGNDPSPAKIFKRYCLRMPVIDKDN